GGTLFLDEIANVSLNLQAKLLRVLQTGELERVGSSKTRRVDVRILAATNADVNAELAAGRFRQDLLFRLNTIEIYLPPLRERRVLRAQGDMVRAGDLGLRPPASPGSPRLEEMSLEEVERFLVQKTLARSNGNVSQAAKALGLSRSGLYRRMQKYGL